MGTVASDITASPVSLVVTPDTFIRAETDRYFARIAGQAGGVNKFLYYRSLMPLDRQTIVRLNRDTLYMGAVVDTAGGASVTLPPMTEDRYASVLVVDNDHYAPTVFYEPGTHLLPADTRYVMLVVRLQLFDPRSDEELARVHDLQDSFVIRAASARPFEPPRWDLPSLNKLRVRYQHDLDGFRSIPPDWQGARGTVDEDRRHLAAAGAWGLLPRSDAAYFDYKRPLPYDHCHVATYDVPENDGFWSLTVYGRDGYMKSDNNVLNPSNTSLNPDGTFTVHFGTEAMCGDVANRLDISDGWNLTLRVYRPRGAAADGTYRMPDPTPLV